MFAVRPTIDETPVSEMLRALRGRQHSELVREVRAVGILGQQFRRPPKNHAPSAMARPAQRVNANPVDDYERLCHDIYRIFALLEHLAP
jgi:hypothetical protein